jgi:hypothetical protein
MRTILLLFIVLSFSCSQREKVEVYQPLHYSIYFGETKAGFYEAVQKDDGTYSFVTEFNDRGRGPHLEELIRLDENGSIESLQILGHNYLKDTVSEVFSVTNNQATWSSTTEKGTSPAGGFFVGMNSMFGNSELLIRSMLQSPSQSLDLLPGGASKITRVENVNLGDTIKLKLIEYTGFSFSPSYLFLDKANRFFAAPSSWLSCVQDGYESFLPDLLAIQTRIEKEYYEKIAKELTEKPTGKLIIKNVNVFDPATEKLLNNQTVVVNGDKIESIGGSPGPVPQGATIIDGTNKTLLPGLFDNHVHIARADGILHIAAGVTSVRDMGNAFDLPETVKDFDDNVVIGPRMATMCGFIDQKSPYSGPAGKIISTLNEGIEAVQFYKDKGYQQVKLYSSVDPTWVKPIANEAHKLGLRVSGHIPAHMLAQQAVIDGYDEIQHANMLALNFLPDTIDTRTPKRFSMVGQHTHSLDLNSDAFKKFVRLLKDKKIVSDPTLATFEGMFCSQAGEVDPMIESVIQRLPINVQRGFYSGGLPMVKGTEEQYKKSYEKLLGIVRALHEAGVTVIPGTDATPGFALHREFELYVKAGIPASAVLKMATLTSAQVSSLSDKLGSIVPGKLADMILVDGNPLEDITRIRRVEITIKNGNLYRTEKLNGAIGVKHYQ